MPGENQNNPEYEYIQAATRPMPTPNDIPIRMYAKGLDLSHPKNIVGMNRKKKYASR